jgi:hypothetical protein
MSIAWAACEAGNRAAFIQLYLKGMFAKNFFWAQINTCGHASQVKRFPPGPHHICCKGRRATNVGRWEKKDKLIFFYRNPVPDTRHPL